MIRLNKYTTPGETHATDGLAQGGNPLWQAISVIVGLGVFALLFVLGLVVLAVFAGLVAVGLVAWWIRGWWYRRRYGPTEVSREASGDYIVAEYTVIEREREGPSERTQR